MLVTVVAALRGGWWVATTPVWSPIDEQAHYDYVRAVANFDMPVVGETVVHPDVHAAAKNPPTFAHSYEAAQPPLYYAAMAPVWKATRGWGLLASIYALRVASLLIALALIPLVWLAARELFPARPEIGIAAAAVTALLSGVNGNLAIVANDGLMTVLAAATLLAMARVVQRGLGTRAALAVGALVGAALLTKLTAVALVGVVAIGALVAARRHGQRYREVLRFGAVAGGVTALLLAPWVAWNVATYGGLSASAQLDAITGPMQTDPPVNLDGLRLRLDQAGHGFWDHQLLDTTTSATGTLWFLFVLVVGAAALARHQPHRGVLVWLFSAWPIAFAGMAFVILGASGGRSDIAGRHLYAALPALVLATVASAYFVAERLAPYALGAVGAVALSFEARDAPAVIGLLHGNDAPDPTLVSLPPTVWAAAIWLSVAGLAARNILRWGRRVSGAGASRLSYSASP